MITNGLQTLSLKGLIVCILSFVSQMLSQLLTSALIALKELETIHK